jgi:thioredoxin reductase (NADPH)
MAVLDCIIIGAGPAGLTAAIYLARFRRNVIVLDGGRSRAHMIPVSRNYPGFLSGINGRNLIDNLVEQTNTFGGSVIREKAEELRKIDDIFRVVTSKNILFAKNIILSTGIQDKQLPINNWEENVCKGVIRLCPICDAYDVPNGKIAIISTAESGPILKV